MSDGSARRLRLVVMLQLDELTTQVECILFFDSLKHDLDDSPRPRY